MSIPISDPWVWRLLAVVIGAIFGSFFTVAIHRWPQELSVIKPASRCPSCGKLLRWHDNIPILGWLLRRGRSGCCGTPISPRYLAVELLTAVLALALVERLMPALCTRGSLQQGALLELLVGGIFLGGLIIATFVDLEHFIIPDEVSLGGGMALLALGAFRDAADPSDLLLGAGMGYLIIQVPFIWLYEALRGRRGMGEGDSKLLFFIGACTGPAGVLFSLVAASFQGLIAAVALRKQLPEAPTEATPKEENGSWGQTKLPFGPLLALSALEYYFFGDVLIGAYLKLISF